jgi:hypothetical protein
MSADDMDGRIKQLAALVENDECHWNMDGPPESDCVDVLVSDLRALLLDYQERGRALERVTDLLASANRSTDRPSDYVSRAVMEARATLKGKSHD